MKIKSDGDKFEDSNFEANEIDDNAIAADGNAIVDDDE